MSKWEYVKGLFLIFGIPAVVYTVAKTDPFIFLSEDKEFDKISFLLVSAPYWVALFYAHKYKQQYDRLKGKK